MLLVVTCADRCHNLVMMHFGVDDEDAFYAAAERLQDELQEWLGGEAELDPEAWLDARILLDWKWGYGDGRLDTLSLSEVNEFLLEWCPRKLSFPPEAWLSVIEGVRAWVLFLDSTGRWNGAGLVPLLTRLDTIEPEFVDAMGNPSNFGLAKGMFAGGAAATGIIPDLDDPESIEAMMTAFNDLPLDERAAIVDPLTANMAGAGFGPEPDRIALPPVADPDPAAMAAAISAAPILAQVDAVRAYLGKGKTLTATGNPKVVDIKALATMLGTDDLLDTTEPFDHKVRSADQLPHTQYLLDAFDDSQAIEFVGNKMQADPVWDDMDDLERVVTLFETLMGMGPVAARGLPYSQNEDMLIEDGFGHWVVPLLYNETIDMDDLVDTATQVVADAGLGIGPTKREHVERRVEQIFDVATRCGVIIRTGARIESDEWGTNEYPRGGEVRATASGLVLLRMLVWQAGYDVEPLTDLADASGVEFVNAVSLGRGSDSASLLDTWMPGSSDATKAEALVDAMVECGHSGGRLAAFAMLIHLGVAAIEAMGPLIGGPLEGHAFVFFTEIGYEEMGLTDQGVTEAADGLPTSMSMVVDLLADDLSHSPEAMLERWDILAQPEGLESLPDVQHRELHELLLADMWRVDLPETATVLEALGKHIPDKALAKAARKALFKHRSH